MRANVTAKKSLLVEFIQAIVHPIYSIHTMTIYIINNRFIGLTTQKHLKKVFSGIQHCL